MNNPLSLLNILLMLTGLVILLISVGVTLLRVRSNPSTAVKAGFVSVLLALVACILIAFGLGSIAFSPTAVTVAAAPANRMPGGLLALIGGLVIALLGYILFRNERQRDDFNPTVSPGLLYLGVGIFVLAAALIIPTLPRQFTAARAAVAPTSTDRPLPTRADQETSTATVTLQPSLTPSELPSLTPTSDDSATPLATAIAYQHSQIVNPTGCTVVAQTMLNLRGDPSDRQKAMGRVFAGSLLQVIGKTTDKQWVRVIYNDGQNSIQGWVNAQFIMVGATCADSSIPVIVPSPTSTRTPYPSRTPRPSATPKG